MLCYSRNYLLSLSMWWKIPNFCGSQISRLCNGRQWTSPVPSGVWNSLKSAGILRKLRGKRGGTSVHSEHHIKSLSTPVYENKYQDSITMLSEVRRRHLTSSLNIQSDFNSKNCVNRGNIIIVPRSPLPPKACTSKPLDFSLLNARSIRNKSLSIKDMIVEYDIDVLALTETWLRSDDSDDHIIQNICPTGYELYSVPRGSKGGGVALLYKKLLRFQKSSCVKNKFKSFEYTDLVMLHSSTSLRVVIIYRPPPSRSNNSSITLFFEEFPVFLESIATASGSLLMVGDFNFHIDDKHDVTAFRFLQLLDAFNLCQNISQPTHTNGHILDLIITRADENIASNFTVFDPVLSDHFVVGCTLSLRKRPFEKKEICYRKLKSVNIEDFRQDIANSALVDFTDDLDHAVDLYNGVLSNLLNKYAPLKKRVITLRPLAPWYSDEINDEKKKRRKFERRWRATRLTMDRDLYVNQCKVVNRCIFKSKMDYYSTLIEERRSDPKLLFATVSKLLHRQAPRQLPSSEDDKVLADAFADHFIDKITKISKTLEEKRTDIGDVFSEKTCCTHKFRNFKSVTSEDLSELIGNSSRKSCSLDPVPVLILKQCIDLLLPSITRIVNTSLQNGIFHEEFKVGLVLPLLKKSSLDREVLGNYRSISNLSFLSKCCEKVVSSQLNQHLCRNNLQEVFQSAYKPYHSTESALVRVQNDVLRAIDEDRCVMLLFLDLSAAFDTVNHQVLLSRMSDRFGLEGIVLEWFGSYLSGRKQYVNINNSSSSCRDLNCGVPQGSVLRPNSILVVYCSSWRYTKALWCIISYVC